MSIKILLADDHKVVRQGLCALLEKEPDMEVVAEAEGGLEAVRMAGKLLPDVAIVDIGMPDMNGVEATRKIVAANSRVMVVALSMHSDRRFVDRMFRAGASGYLLKDCAFEELTTAVRTVAGRRYYLSPGIAGVLLEEYRRRPASPESALEILTAREREVLQLLAEGKTTKEIAALICVSGKTVETHRQHLMEKLDLHSVAEITKFAVREGLTSLEK